MLLPPFGQFQEKIKKKGNNEDLKGDPNRKGINDDKITTRGIGREGCSAGSHCF